MLSWQPQKEIDPLKLSELEDKAEHCYPFYGQSTVNNGIISYNQLKKSVLNNQEGKPTILIHSNNQNIVYLETPFYLKDGHGATSVLQSPYLNRINQMFIVSAIDKVIKEKFGYNNKATKIELKKTVIKLPTKNGKPDYDFMESFIAKLEEERITELTAYLKISGLDDYELTEEEKELIDNIGNIQFIEKDITKVFKINNTKNILSRDIVENSGETPYLCASSENNAVSSYITYDESLMEKGNCIFIGGKTFVVSYQKKDFYSNDSHNLVLYLKEHERNEDNQLFLVACVYKGLSHKYSWGDSVSRKKILNDKLMVPTVNGKIDYDIMERVIRAVKKLVIKDVVLYADNKINATKSVISK